MINFTRSLRLYTCFRFSLISIHMSDIYQEMLVGYVLSLFTSGFAREPENYESRCFGPGFRRTRLTTSGRGILRSVGRVYNGVLLVDNIPLHRKLCRTHLVASVFRRTEGIRDSSESRCSRKELRTNCALQYVR